MKTLEWSQPCVRPHVCCHATRQEFAADSARSVHAFCSLFLVPTSTRSPVVIHYTVTQVNLPTKMSETSPFSKKPQNKYQENKKRYTYKCTTIIIQTFFRPHNIIVLHKKAYLKPKTTLKQKMETKENANHKT